MRSPLVFIVLVPEVVTTTDIVLICDPYLGVIPVLVITEYIEIVPYVVAL